MKPVLPLLGLLVLLLPSPALAWGPEGHEVVAHVAAMNLTPRARSGVAALLGGEAEAMMALNANWADEIRHDRPQTSPWHYVNIEIDGDLHYSAPRDCARDDCVVAQILRNEGVLKSRAAAAGKIEALRFLIHFVGDIHQPLHAGEDHDQGGNRILLRYRGARTNLHHIWDDEMVAVQGRNPVVLARAIDTEFAPAQKSRLAAGTPREWAEESAKLARDVIYRAGPPRTVSERYIRDNAPLARRQMARAGFALAAILNDIYR